MRRAGIDLDGVGLVVAIETVAKAPHVGQRDDVIGLAEYAEHRAFDARDDLVERRRKALVDLPFAVAGGAVPHQRRGNRVRGGEHQRMTAGLADALHRDLGAIDLRQLGEFGNRGRDMLVQLGVLERVADIAAVQRILIGIPVIEIRRDADVAFARKARGEIASVLHQAIALVHEHDGGDFCRRRPATQETPAAAGTMNIPSDDSVTSTPILRRCSPKSRPQTRRQACGTRPRRQVQRGSFSHSAAAPSPMSGSRHATRLVIDAILGQRMFGIADRRQQPLMKNIPPHRPRRCGSASG